MPKKDFSASPLMQFLPQNTEPAEANKPPAQMPATEYQRHIAEKSWADPRTRRVQLLMRPSIYADIQSIAEQKMTSFNHLVETVLEDFITKTRNEQARRERLARREQGKG